MLAQLPQGRQPCFAFEPDRLSCESRNPWLAAAVTCLSDRFRRQIGPPASAAMTTSGVPPDSSRFRGIRSGRLDARPDFVAHALGILAQVERGLALGDHFGGREDSRVI